MYVLCIFMNSEKVNENFPVNKIEQIQASFMKKLRDINLNFQKKENVFQYIYITTSQYLALTVL